TGIALRQARWRIAVRAALLVVIGIVLAKATEATGFLLTVIIPFYGMYFLLSLPFVGLRSRGLLVAAGTAAVLGPQLSFVLRSWIERTPAAQGAVDAINSVDPGHLLADAGVLDLRSEERRGGKGGRRRGGQRRGTAGAHQLTTCRSE